MESLLRYFMKNYGMELYQTSYRKDGSVGSVVADLDSVLRVGSMYDLSVAHVDCYMSAVADQVSRLSVRIGYLSTCVLLLVGGSRKVYAEVVVYALYETGAVRAVGKACAAPYIGIAYELGSVVYHGRTGTGS